MGMIKDMATAVDEEDRKEVLEGLANKFVFMVMKAKSPLPLPTIISSWLQDHEIEVMREYLKTHGLKQDEDFKWCSRLKRK